MTCENCGSELKPGRSFCTACGSASRADGESSFPRSAVKVFPATQRNPRKQDALRKSRIVLRGAIFGTLLAIIFIVVGAIEVLKHASEAARTKAAVPTTSYIAEPVASIPVKQELPTVTPISQEESDSVAVDSSDIPVLNPIRFRSATPEESSFMASQPQVKQIVSGDYKLATANLCEDRVTDTILISTSSELCGSGGCEAIVFEKNSGGISIMLDQNLPDSLAVINTKFNGCDSLVATDETGKIVLGDKPGTPLFGKQLIYPLHGK